MSVKGYANGFKYSYYFAMALVYLAVLLGWAFFLGAFDQNETESALRIRNAAIAMPLMTVFALVSTSFLLHKSFFSLKYIIDKSNGQKYTPIILTGFYIKIKKLKVISVICGISITLLYLYVENLLALNLDPLSLFMNFSAIPFWSALCFFVFNLLYITRYVISNFLDHDSLDLFGIKELQPISDLVIYNTAICASLMAITPVFWLGKSVPLVDLGLVTLVFVLFGLYLFMPVFKVQKIIVSKKYLAIDRINSAIHHLMVSNHVSIRSDVLLRSELIRELASLISAKREIHASSEWPIDLPQGIKGILIGMSIPLSWAAGSMVESFISRFNIFSQTL